jgi:small subunit ribosomal protein S14
MARKAKIQKDLRLTKLNSNPERIKRRAELKAIISSSDESVTAEMKMEAAFALQKRPLNESKCRQTSRCPQCGRIHGYMRRFDLCRLCVRKFFRSAYLPGVTMSSW